MRKNKLFIEDAYPILCFFLKMVGLMHCGRDEKGELTIFYRRSVGMVITALLLIMLIVSHCLILSTVEYFEILSIIAYISSCIYILLSIYQTFVNRTYKLKYLKLIGPSFEGSATFYQSIMVDLEWMIYIVSAGLVNCFLEPGEWNLASLWFPVINVLPFLLDCLYRTLLEPLVKSCSSLNSQIHSTRNILESEDKINIQEHRPMKPSVDLQMVEFMIESRMKQLITQISLFYKVSIFL